MFQLKILTYLLAGLFLVSLVSAATIYGTVYDLSLRKVNNARVEINTIPKQIMIAQNSTYSFNVPNGAYTIKAEVMRKNVAVESAEENITVKQDGNYVVDLILFPNVEEGVEDANIDVNSSLIVENKTANNFLAFFIVLMVLLIILIAALYLKQKKSKQKIKEAKQEQQKQEPSEDIDLEQIIRIIKQEGGRATQKEIRKQIPLSEAKISLMIAELEHKGIIEKIKKGRGNIIILKKK